MVVHLGRRDRGVHRTVNIEPQLESYRGNDPLRLEVRAFQGSKETWPPTTRFKFCITLKQVETAALATESSDPLFSQKFSGKRTLRSRLPRDSELFGAQLLAPFCFGFGYLFHTSKKDQF